MGPRGRAGEQRGNQFYRECGKDSRGGFSAGAGGESGGAVFVGKGAWRGNAGTEVGKHCERGVDCRTGRRRGSRGVQHLETRLDWVDANAGGGMGRARSAGKRGVSRLGEDGNGSRRPGGGEVQRCGYYRTRAEWAIWLSRWYCLYDSAFRL